MLHGQHRKLWALAKTRLKSLKNRLRRVNESHNPHKHRHKQQTIAWIPSGNGQKKTMTLAVISNIS